MTDDRQRKANLRLGLVLAVVAFGFALVFVGKLLFLGPN